MGEVLPIRAGGIEKLDRRRRWWTANYDQFAKALL
jgi:hypothetical protein